MQVHIKPASLGGTVSAIPSKSDAHRVLIAAGLADAPTAVGLKSSSQDIDATISCLNAMGAAISVQDGQAAVSPIASPPTAPQLDCAESGTTLRLLLPVAAAVCDNSRVTGRGRLPERPLAELLHCLQPHGVQFDNDRLPLKISGRMQPGVYEIPGNVSSQYISGLLLALPLLDGDSRIQLSSPLESAGYVDMTLSALARFGILATRQADGFFVPGNQRYRSPGETQIEGDWSSAAFYLAAGALHKPIAITGLQQESAQPDKSILELLRRFGAQVQVNGGDTVTVSPAPLKGIDIDVSQAPDLVPILAVVGALSQGQTRLYNARRLRMKESDRLSSVAAMLAALGAQAQELPDELRITGGALTGGTVDAWGDHRIAMAAAIAASAASGNTIITGAACVSKSYPSFYEDFTALGGNTDVVRVW